MVDLIAGRFRLMRRIAAGGMGDVWRAEDIVLKRDVAVKLLHPNLSDNEKFQVRFESEARAIASIQSPNVAGLHDFGREDGRLGPRSYLVMELISGRPLSDLIDENGGIRPAETMRIIGEAAEGLAAVHAAGVMHRDVKPANILVDENGNVKIIDFGIARAAGEVGITDTGKVMGTLGYASPEQLSGDEQLTFATDIYSLGIVAYECLTGSTPFRSPNPQAVMHGHLAKEPALLPDSVPTEVATVVMKALHKEATDRWESMEYMAVQCRIARGFTDATQLRPAAGDRESDAAQRETDDILLDIGGRDTSEVTQGEALPEIKTTSMWRRRRGLMVSATVVVLALVGLLWSLTGQPPPTDSTDAAAAPGLSDGSDALTTSVDTSSSRSGAEKSTSSDRPTTTSDGPSGSDGQPGDDGGGDDGDDNEGGDDDEDKDGTPVPDIIGKRTYEVSTYLRMGGFSRWVASPVEAKDGEPNCVVIATDPAPGARVDPSTPIQFYYRDTNRRCIIGG